MKFILISLVLAVLLSGCILQSGAHIATGDAMPKTSSEQIKLYSYPPKHYKTLGIVAGKARHAFASEQTRINVAIERMKKEASALGANGIILQAIGDLAAHSAVAQVIGDKIITTSTHHSTASGTAIYVIEE